MLGHGEPHEEDFKNKVILMMKYLKHNAFVSVCVHAGGHVVLQMIVFQLAIGKPGRLF